MGDAGIARRHVEVAAVAARHAGDRGVVRHHAHILVRAEEDLVDFRQRGVAARHQDDEGAHPFLRHGAIDMAVHFHFDLVLPVFLVARGKLDKHGAPVAARGAHEIMLHLATGDQIRAQAQGQLRRAGGAHAAQFHLQGLSSACRAGIEAADVQVGLHWLVGGRHRCRRNGRWRACRGGRRR